MTAENKGLWLGLLGVCIFALTLPMTRLATGTSDAPQLSPWFVTWGRAALAGVLSAAYLYFSRARLPQAQERGPLVLSLIGNVVGYPLLASYTAYKSGHAMNNQLLRALLAEKDAWEIVSFEDEAKAPRGLAELAPAW